MAKQKSMMDYMKSRNSMQLRGDDPTSKKGPVDPKKKTKPAKKPKNYNYAAEEKKMVEKYYDPGVSISKSDQWEIEDSFEPKRKEWTAAYNRGEMKKSALRDSISSTLGPNSKVGDYMPQKSKKSRKKVSWWIGGTAANPWFRFETPNIWGGGTKGTQEPKKKRK